MNRVVKILIDDDGYENDNPDWHLVSGVDAQRTLCGGEVFGEGESELTVYKTKDVKRGGISCPQCLSIIKEIKSVRL